MQLNHLFVIHLPRSVLCGSGIAQAAEVAQIAQISQIPQVPQIPRKGEGVFSIETCQRWVWVGFDRVNPQWILDLQALGARVYRGENAYRFLLRMACGLESVVLGETDVFGQLKEAWKTALAQNRASLSDLIPWMNRVFEDTKEIRATYLQNTGGSSYGSLVRRLIGHEDRPSTVFLVGAGQIASSVAPFLLSEQTTLRIWNRDPIRLCSLHDEIMSHPHFKGKVEQVHSLESQQQAWETSDHIVVCVPPGLESEQKWLGWGTHSRAQTVIHLGVHQHESAKWKEAFQSRFFHLDDIFELQKGAQSVRTSQIAQAERSCVEKAKLRALGGLLSIPHGWEDLAVFA